MFVRNVSLYLKPHSLPEFLRLMDSDVIPLLRKQKGFQDAITLVVPGGREIVAMSFWEQEENARVYTTTGYLGVLKILEQLLDGSPHLRTLDVVSSTFHKLPSRAAA